MYKIFSAAAVIALSLSGAAQASPLAAPLAQAAQDDFIVQAQAQTQAKPSKPARRRAQQPRRQQPQQPPRQQQQQQAPSGGGLIPG